jgi:short subunit dehydrogenase-like uncharacterized protein
MHVTVAVVGCNAAGMAELDVLLFGPTGVTGREVARHLARRAPELGLSWGVAGRSRERMDDVLADLPAAPDAVLRADVGDRASVEAAVGSASVVANLVGPYARHGEPVYRACAAQGVDEIDLTGEMDWVRRMIDAYDEKATATGARIVPTSGFEALPFDLATLLASSVLHERTGKAVLSVDVAVTMRSERRTARITDAVSGGTYVSGVEALRRDTGAALRDPYLLDPASSHTGGRYDVRPRRHSATGQWLSPMFPTPFLNPPVVHRSAALLRDAGDPTFDPDFEYREGVVTEAGVPERAAGAAAVVLWGLTAGFGALGRLPGPVRRPVARGLLAVGPKPGQGPAPEDLDAWSYRLQVTATDTRGSAQDVVVEAAGHPGYKSTATMVGEAALAMADPSVELPDAAGFLTPATALGLPVLDRLGEAGVRFSLV